MTKKACQTAKRFSLVMRGLDPRIHPSAKKMDCRIKSGNDDQSRIQMSNSHVSSTRV